MKRLPKKYLTPGDIHLNFCTGEGICQKNMSRAIPRIPKNAINTSGEIRHRLHHIIINVIKEALTIFVNHDKVDSIEVGMNGFQSDSCWTLKLDYFTPTIHMENAHNSILK